MKSKYFKAHELVPEHIYNERGLKSWELLDPRLIETIDALKEQFNVGTMTINNYFWNGDRHWSGLRTPGSKYYSETSQHSFGRAIDAVFSDYTAEEVRLYVIDNPKQFPHIKGIELGIDWFHCDLRNSNERKMFYP